MAKAHKISGVDPLGRYDENARVILPQRVEEVYTWEPFIRDAARREALHNMRISIKRLRYTMEIFREAYVAPGQPERFTAFLATLVALQRLLGAVHDADVALGVLSERRSGMQPLIARTAATRAAAYARFLAAWDTLAASDFKGRFLRFLRA